MKYTIMAGNPVDGVTLWGAFPDAESANEWADQQRWDDAFYCVAIQPAGEDSDDE